MKRTFSRRIFSPTLFFSDLRFLFGHMLEIQAAMRNTQIDVKFREKIMMIVTAVNGCTYCTWFHAKVAVSSGMNSEEIKNMLDLQFRTDASDFELQGLLYAQHYAETNRHPEKEMTDRLYAYYGETTASHIRLIIRMIFFGNLYGNTFDAFLSRFQGKKPGKGNILFEIFFFLVNAPIFLPLRFHLEKNANQKSS